VRVRCAAAYAAMSAILCWRCFWPFDPTRLAMARIVLALNPAIRVALILMAAAALLAMQAIFLK
jgi:hypothetical protein